MTNLISDIELACMRDVLESTALPGTCDILTLTQTADGQGGYTDAWGTATAGVACRIDPRNNREQLSGQAIQPFRRFIVTLPHDTTVTEANRLKIGTISYNILGIDGGKSWDLDLRLEVEKV